MKMGFCTFLSVFVSFSAFCIQLASSNIPPTLSNCVILNSTYVKKLGGSTSCDGIFSVNEETPIGLSLIELSATDPENDQVTFTLKGSQDALRLFKLTTTPVTRQARVIVDSRIDIEQMSNNLPRLDLSMDDKQGNSDIPVTVNIFIQDINDNTPEFINQPYRWDIPENTLGASFTFQVVDRDFGISDFSNMIITISGVSGITIDGVFGNLTVQFRKLTSSDPASLGKTGGIWTATIKLLKELDYETNRFYQISVRADDKMSGGISVFTDIIINVIDKQDTPPFFEGVPYMKSLPENSPVGTSVIRIVAKDGDRGLPNPIEYSMDLSNNLTRYFNIDNTTGWITVSNINLDRESGEIQSLFGTFDFPVIAKEVSAVAQQPNLSQSTTTVRITVLDSNDFAPTFNSHLYQATTVENSQVGIPISVIPLITVTDLDSGTNGQFEVFLSQNGLPFDVFDVSPTTAVKEATLIIRVKNSTVLDYEKVKSIVFQITAVETKTAEKMNSTATVNLTLIDANDNRPVFAQTKYVFNLTENAPNGTFVGKIIATDLDSGVFGEISYKLDGTDASKFRVNTSTGDIYVNVNADADHNLLDREKFSNIFLTFQATDGGGFISTVQLEVQLQDQNDQYPKFSRNKYSGVVPENTLVFETPVQVEATDIDLPPNNIIYYSIISGDSSSYFTVNNVTGVIGLLKTIDYEALSNKTFYLTVMAKDGGVPPLNTTVMVEIRVEDRNDMAPVCSQSLYNASVPENATSGYVLTQINATDGDAPGTSNSAVFLRIQSGAADKFTMNGDTGLISVERGADLDVNKYGKQYNLTIMAYDKGSPQLSGSCLVQVTVKDVNNQAPYFDPLVRRELVQENLPLNSPLILSSPYLAKDPDFSAVLQYKILTDKMSAKLGNGQPVQLSSYNFTAVFSMSHNGTIYIINELDRERAEEITIPIEVRDLAAETALPIQTAVGTLILTISDLNDVAPVFSSPAVDNKYNISLSEALVPTIEISLKAVATDADKSTVEIIYGISPASTLFKIDAKSAQVSLISALDRETVDNHIFYITANDSVHVTTATVYVTVLDANDVSPYFTIFNEMLFIMENTTVGTNLTTVQAKDNDTGKFAEVHYRILSGGGGKFAINDVTGVLRLIEPLNRDLPLGASYTILIEAYDNPGSTDSRTTKKEMSITIIDINDETPKFSNPSYTFSVMESMLADQRIETIPATDADEGDNAAITFSLKAQEGANNVKGLQLFKVITVSSSSGYSAELKANQSLKNAVGVFNLILLATDGGKPSLTGQTNLSITVVDVNDYAPRFTFPIPPEYGLTVNESTNASTTIGKELMIAKAVDDDFGLNAEVRFSLESSSGDHKSFEINNVTGKVIILVALDRETKPQYRFHIKAYDLGPLVSLSSSVNIIVDVWDVDEHPPTFPAGFRVQTLQFPENYVITTGMMVPGENFTGVLVGNVAKAIDLDASGSVAKMCYFIITQAYDYFYLHKNKGDLYLLKTLDREAVAQHEIAIIAVGESYCNSNRYLWKNSPHNRVKRYLDDQPIVYNPSDPSMSKIIVAVGDQNDNPPVWSSTRFFGGVTVNDPPGTTVFRFGDYASDKDIGNNSMLVYTMYGLQASDSLKIKLQERKIFDNVFSLDSATGLLKTGDKTYFQEDMFGSLSFLVNVSDGQTAVTANCTIYVLSLDQQVIAVFRDNTANITKIRDKFAEYLSNITGWRVVVDNIVTHKNADGTADNRQTDMYLHAINNADNTIIPAIEFRDKLDLLWEYLKTLYNEYHVTEVKLAKLAATPNNDLQVARIALVAVACGLGILLCFACVSLWSCRRMYRRKLKAATAVAFGPGGQLNHLRMPGTNMHTYEGSNPIWMETYDASQQNNNLAYDSDHDSIDNNTIDLKMNGQIGEVEKSMMFYNDANSDTGSMGKSPFKDKFADDSILNAALDSKPFSPSNGSTLKNGDLYSNGGVTPHTLDKLPFTNI